MQLADDPAQVKLPVKQVDLSQVFFYILYKQIEKIHNFTSWASEKISFVNFALVFERQEGQHFTDSIKSWHLVIHDLPSVCLNQVSYQLLMWDVKRINL